MLQIDALVSKTGKLPEDFLLADLDQMSFLIKVLLPCCGHHASAPDNCRFSVRRCDCTRPSRSFVAFSTRYAGLFDAIASSDDA